MGEAEALALSDVDAGAFDAALAGRPCWLAEHGGGRRLLPVLRWRAEPDEADAALLDRCVGPTLDVGCGRGRLTAAVTPPGCSTAVSS